MQTYLKIKNQLLREFLAESFGIYILLTFGLASCAQVERKELECF